MVPSNAPRRLLLRGGIIQPVQTHQHDAQLAAQVHLDHPIAPLPGFLHARTQGIRSQRMASGHGLDNPKLTQRSRQLPDGSRCARLLDHLAQGADGALQVALRALHGRLQDQRFEAISFVVRRIGQAIHFDRSGPDIALAQHPAYAVVLAGEGGHHAQAVGRGGLHLCISQLLRQVLGLLEQPGGSSTVATIQLRQTQVHQRAGEDRRGSRRFAAEFFQQRDARIHRAAIHQHQRQQVPGRVVLRLGSHHLLKNPPRSTQITALVACQALPIACRKPPTGLRQRGIQRRRLIELSGLQRGGSRLDSLLRRVGNLHLTHIHQPPRGGGGCGQQEQEANQRHGGALYHGNETQGGCAPYSASRATSSCACTSG